MKIKSLRMVFGVLLIFALIVGCTPAPAPEADVDQPDEVVDAVDVIELDVFHFYGEGVADQPQILEWTKVFEAAHPEYKINWTWGGSEAMALFQARINANDPPDVFMSNDAVVAVLAREGVILPVDQYLEGQNYEGDAKWGDTFVTGLLDNSFIEDGAKGAAYYGIPDNMHFGGIFYNKGMFDQNGYQIPKTWSEMLALCDQIDADEGIPCFGADNFNGYNARPHFYLMAYNAGPDVLYDTAMGKEGTSFDTPEFLKAAQMFQELTTEYYQSGWQGNQWPAGQVDWANEGQAMIFMPSWLPSELMTTKADGFEMDVFGVPYVDDGVVQNPLIEVKYNGWVVPDGAENPDDAIFFIKYLTSREYQQDRTERAAMPSVLAALDLPADLQSFQPVFEEGQVFPFAFGLDADASQWLSQVFYPLNDVFAYGDMTPEDFIAELEKETKAFYSE
jgi:raffinose/stachyose/melibiose transport system substrate-binding protein